MPDVRESALQYAHANRPRFVEELKALLRIPSVSTEPENKPDMQRTAEWLADHLRRLGMQGVQILPTKGHPVVYAEWLKAGNNLPTVLIYGHYDVQPAEPLELWQSPPFDPTQRGDDLFARGASDMKGQLMATLDAIEALMHNGGLPVNVKFILEGEEEIGSPNLGPFIQEHKALLASDMALNPDTGMIAADTPTIVYALRGLAYFELRVYGAEHDLHSGMYGGVVHNPAQVLCELIAGMHDQDGRILLPGYYDKVRPLSEEERAELARLDMTDNYYLQKTGAPALWGEKGFTPAERTGARPTLEVNGLYSGYTGEGSKTVLPAWAMAKLSMRLVPDQDPAEVHRQLLQYLTERAPHSVRWEVTPMAGGPACITDRNSAGVQALSRALATVWGKPPVFKREGGSVPIVADMQEILKIDSVLTGFGLPDDNIHAPNEKLHVPTWARGIDALIHFFYNLRDSN